jgi:hypothetical protein
MVQMLGVGSTKGITQSFKLACLLPCCPQRVGDELGNGAAANGDGLLVAGNLDAAQLAQVDLNAVVHPAQGGDGPVHAIVREERKVELAGEFDLTTLVPTVETKRHKGEEEEGGGVALTVSTTSFSVPTTTEMLTRGACSADHLSDVWLNPLDPGR